MIVINGKEEALPEMSITELMQLKGFRLEYVAVEQNGRIVPKAAYGDSQIHDGDRLEVVSFVGGG